MDDLARVFGVPFNELLREHPQEVEEGPEPAGPEPSWEAGGPGYIAESAAGACSGGGFSPSVIEPRQMQEWIRLAVREALEEALTEGGGRLGREEPSAGGADPPGRRRRRARGSEGGE